MVRQSIETGIDRWHVAVPWHRMLQELDYIGNAMRGNVRLACRPAVAEEKPDVARDEVAHGAQPRERDR
jgi:hypothetical protein